MQALCHSKLAIAIVINSVVVATNTECLWINPTRLQHWFQQKIWKVEQYYIVHQEIQQSGETVG